MIEIDNLYCMRGSGEQAFSIHVPYLNIQAGEIIAITGVSGSGKSTLLEILGLIFPPQSGSLRWQLPKRNIDISHLWQNHPQQLDSLRMRYLGFVLQTGGLLPFLTVQENILLPKQLLRQGESWDVELQVIVEQLDILHLLIKKPYQLSIGERQRVAIARALAHHPLLLLADEPTSALDPARAESVMQLFVELMRSQKRTAVIVTHDYSWIGRLGLREIRASLQSGGKTACFS
ncbi:MAG: ABC transporter ATP-binding protein [Methylococcales bacterium]|nr:ABC transporter ATP-binding protein [Methylococcales bacterium]